MTIEELKALKEIVIEEFTTEYGATKGLTPAGEALLSLITAEIAQQSIADEDVKEAIAYIKGSYGDVPFWSKSRRQTIITALQQMRTEPCDDCVYWKERNAKVSEYRKHYMDNQWLEIFKNCPSCGRALKGENE